MNPEVAVPIAFLLVVLLIVKSLLNYRQKRQERWHQSLQVALQSEQKVDEQLLHKLSSALDPQRSDLRKALLFLSIAIVFVLLAVFAPFGDPDGRKAMLMMAAFPLMFSVTYLLFWKFWYK